jgi:drug/metabolite transporter (DMT)-like permease
MPLSIFKKPPALLMALVCALLWGSAFPVIKSVYLHWKENGVQVGLFEIWLFAGVRFTISGLGLLPTAKNPLAELRATPLRLTVGFALSQTFFQYVFFYLAVFASGGALAAMLVATGSFWWMLLAPLATNGAAWPNRWQWLALGVGGVGVTMAVYAPGVGAGQPLLGAGLQLAATFCGAVGVILFGKIKPTMGSRAATGTSLALGGLGLILLAFPAWGRLAELFDGFVLAWTLWLAFVSAAAFSLWNHLSTLYPVPLLASYRFLIPVCGVVESLLFLKTESAGWGLIVGGLLVVGSIVWAQRVDLINSK